MDWLTGRGGLAFAYGAENGYQVIPGGTEVRLTRFSQASVAAGLAAVVAREAAANVIIFPLGRGPGRPGGAPELSALAETAKSWAETYESANGALAWRTGQPPSEPWVPLRVTMARQRADRFEADDRAAVARMRSFLGHIEDMPEDERLLMLGYLAEALSRRLGPGEADPNAGRCRGPEGCYLWEQDTCAGFVTGECMP